MEHFFGTKEQDYHSLCHQVLVPAAFNSPIDVVVARGPNGALGIRFMKDECFTLLFVITEIISTGPAFASGLLVAGMHVPGLRFALPGDTSVETDRT